MNFKFYLACALVVLTGFGFAHGQSSTSGNSSNKNGGSGTKPGEVPENDIRVNSALRGLWVVKVAQLQDRGLFAYFKIGQPIALVGRNSVIAYGSPGLEVVRCDYTLDANGSVTQIISLNNGYSWAVSPQLGNNPNWLVQVFHRATNKEVGRLLIEIQ